MKKTKHIELKITNGKINPNQFNFIERLKVFLCMGFKKKEITITFPIDKKIEIHGKQIALKDILKNYEN